MKLDRKKVSLTKQVKKNYEEAAALTGAEGLLFVWELTKEVYSLSGKFDVESRLQRDVISIIRKQS